MKRVNYMKRAAKRFLEGTRFRTPVDAVEAGARTLDQWADFLSEEREIEAQQSHTTDRRRFNRFPAPRPIAQA
jgi:hypothetical protein